ncbi:alpha/beta hydrolase [Streptomonospora algeriensis]|uniref:Alpha/beta hydrolase n=1 Tax=Streptomonospora algeriensis TaxID=995084 RepID=A0ABW3BA33_9ACTN
MFTTLSRRTAALVASSLVVATAGTLAAIQEGAPLPGSAAQAAGAAMPPGGDSAVRPRPGEVASCTKSGSNDTVEVPDKGAPDGERPIWVRRPPGPDSADMPVLYLLHGSTTTHLDVRDAGVGDALDEQMCRTGVEFVVAAPFGQEVGGSDTEWGDAADGDFAIETFVTEKAVDAVEGEHPRPRELRAIGGFSMGGYGSAALSLRHPDTYSQAVSWAGYFKVDDPSDTFGDAPGSHAPDQLLGDKSVRDIRFMLIEGKDDHTPLQTGSIHGEAERFANLLRERDMTVETMHPEGDHSWDTWVPTFPEAVEFLVKGWTSPGGSAGGQGG